jgi:hypothetical protein
VFGDDPDPPAAGHVEQDRFTRTPTGRRTDELADIEMIERPVQAVGTEQSTEDGDGVLDRWSWQTAAVEEEAAAGVLDGVWVAELAVLRAELALEVRGPQGVGSIGDEGRFPGPLGVTARPAGRRLRWETLQRLRGSRAA